ncbi:phosphoglycerate mutase family protein [Paenibacillus senegalensis]|uniref:phosphoglycerate mutase family protein n=1 Tax=Paenibacillus senegalensis TaxID=1465766 RepID=UPI00028993F2|nr:phosphoglycerate mutase family protein [Paenibacillus senegalensis]
MIYVVRHGQTDLNSQGRLQGRQGLPLNEVGRAQAFNLREKLINIKFDFVFSSPQERAIQTAELVTGFNVEADGLKREEVQFNGNIPDPRLYKVVEDVKSFVKRIFNFMEELKIDSEEANILISGHRCTTSCIGAYFNGLPQDGNILKYSSGNGEYKTYTILRD